MKAVKVNPSKMVAWAVAQENRVYEAFPTREEARVAKRDYECCNAEKFKIVKLKFDSEVR